MWLCPNNMYAGGASESCAPASGSRASMIVSWPPLTIRPAPINIQYFAFWKTRDLQTTGMFLTRRDECYAIDESLSGRVDVVIESYRLSIFAFPQSNCCIPRDRGNKIWAWKDDTTNLQVELQLILIWHSGKPRNNHRELQDKIWKLLTSSSWPRSCAVSLYIPKILYDKVEESQSLENDGDNEAPRCSWQRGSLNRHHLAGQLALALDD